MFVLMKIKILQGPCVGQISQLGEYLCIVLVDLCMLLLSCHHPGKDLEHLNVTSPNRHNLLCSEHYLKSP